MTQNADYVAVTGNGSWGGAGKVHAADPATGEDRYGRGIYYKSLCGQLYMHPASVSGARATRAAPFAELPAWTGKCKRCEKIIAAQIDSSGRDA
jgi:hypothetical protein